MKRLLLIAGGTFIGIVAAIIAYTAFVSYAARKAVCNPRYISPENQLRAMEDAGMEINKDTEFTVSQLMQVGRAQDAIKLVYGEMDRLCR